MPADSIDAKTRQQLKDERHNYVLVEGTKSALMFGAAGVFGHLLAQRTWPLYQRQSLPFKSFLLICIPMAAFFTTTDKAAMAADRQYAQRFSITSADELEVKELVPAAASDSALDRAKSFVLGNRFALLGYGWLGAVGLSLMYNFSRKEISLPQKLINSRMVAQSAALAGFAGLAVLTTTSASTPAVRIDPYFQRVVEGTAGPSLNSNGTAVSSSTH
ncbi:hypothetical protein BC831DRAFT_466120 [Entophlyctis helioformis]|nr:hypothetical protein BC831DRAFT_466120 [Entophlyctis helioformis]